MPKRTVGEMRRDFARRNDIVSPPETDAWADIEKVRSAATADRTRALSLKRQFKAWAAKPADASKKRLDLKVFRAPTQKVKR